MLNSGMFKCVQLQVPYTDRFGIKSYKASLFLSKGAVAYTGSHHGPGMGPVLLNNLGCTGVESNLTDCSHSAFGVVSSACRTHLYDASVFCPTGI